MYKNVLNQHIIDVILLFSSCFIAKSASARFSSAGHQSDLDSLKAALTTCGLPQSRVLANRLTFSFTCKQEKERKS